MSWAEQVRNKEGNDDTSLTRETIVFNALTENAEAFNGKEDPGYIRELTLIPGMIGGEGHYKVVLANGYSSRNFTEIGLDKPSYSTDAVICKVGSRYPFTSTFLIQQKHLEQALAKAYGVTFPSIQING